MKEITEIRPFVDPLEIVRLPAARIIGRETRSGGKLGNAAPALWDRVFAAGEHETLLALPVLHKDLLGWTCEYDEKTDTFVYLVCALAPANTPVPDGFAFRDVPETLCAVGLFGEDTKQTCQRARQAGYAPCWDRPGCGWNAELAFREEEEKPPKTNCTPWHWLVPVAPVSK